MLPAVRSRAEGISRAAGLGQKLSHWGELASVDMGPLLDRLGMLETADAQSITGLVLAQLDQRPVETVAPAEPAATPEGPARGIDRGDCLTGARLAQRRPVCGSARLTLNARAAFRQPMGLSKPGFTCVPDAST